MQLSEYLGLELKKLKKANLYRSLRDSKVRLSFSSNNYLGPRSGFGSSRLMTAQQQGYSGLEKLIAEWKGTEAALVFPTGYMTNLGAIQALMQPGDLIITDKLNHASIIDGCYLSGADIRVYKHRDLLSLKKILDATHSKYQKKLIITESVFSMDGDIAPLKEIVALAEFYDCWTYVDEAHSAGVFGEKGAGLIQALGLTERVDISMGTLSKAAGGVGGYIAGSKLLREYLINKARTFIYTTGLPTNTTRELTKNLHWLMSADKLRKKLWANIEYFSKYAAKKGLNITKPVSPIIPIIVGDEAKAIEISQKLFAKGILMPAVRFPTVPKGQARLRCTLTAEHSKRDIEWVINKLPHPSQLR